MLLLDLFVLGAVVAVRVLQSGLWVDMRALERAGLVLTARSLTLSSGATLSYVALPQVREVSPAAALGLSRGDAFMEVGGRPVDN